MPASTSVDCKERKVGARDGVGSDRTFGMQKLYENQLKNDLTIPIMFWNTQCNVGCQVNRLPFLFLPEFQTTDLFMYSWGIFGFGCIFSRTSMSLIYS